MIPLILTANAILFLALAHSRRRHRSWGMAMDSLLERLVPEFLLPGGQRYEKAVAYLHGASGSEASIKATRRQAARWCMVIWLALSLGILALYSGTLPGDTPLRGVTRPEHGSGSKRVRMVAEVFVDDEIIRRNVDLIIREKTLSGHEIESKLDLCASALPGMILGENEDLGCVHQDLILPSYDPSGMIRIRWKSSRPDIIETSGTVLVENTDGPCLVILTADLALEHIVKTVRVPVTVGDPANEKEVRLDIAARIDRLADQISQTTEGAVAMLPASCGDGIGINWKNGHDDAPACIATSLAGFALIRSMLQRRAIAAAEVRRQAMEREFPDFLFKLALLLNAGLVASTAIDRIAEEHVKSGNGFSRPLFEGITAASRRAHQTNTPIEREMRKFAESSGIREIMRFAMILHDNLNKGSRLEEAIAAEGAMLWDQRKKNAEERGRTADTKMSFPLMILLLSLVVTTVAPALMTMD